MILHGNQSQRESRKNATLHRVGSCAWTRPNYSIDNNGGVLRAQEACFRQSLHEIKKNAGQLHLSCAKKGLCPLFLVSFHGLFPDSIHSDGFFCAGMSLAHESFLYEHIRIARLGVLFSDDLCHAAARLDTS